MIRLLLFVFIFSACSVLKKIEGQKPQSQFFKVAWSRALDPEYDSGNLPIGLGSPYMYSNMLFMGDLRGRFVAHNLDDGREIWSFQEKDELAGVAGVYKDLVLYGSYNGRLNARTFTTGELKYSVDLGAPIESAPVLYKDRVFYHLRNHQIFSLDASTGKILWSYRRSVPFTTTLQRVSEILPIDNKLIVGFADGDLVALSLEEGNLLWERKLGSGLKFVDVDATPILFNGKIYTGSIGGGMVALNPDSGQVERTYDFSILRPGFIYGEKLILGTPSGELIVLDSQGEIIQKQKISKFGISAIVEWKQAFVVATLDGVLFELDKNSLQVKSSFPLGSRYSSVMGTLQVLGNYLSVYSARNRLYIFH